METTTKAVENKMGTMPVGRLLLTMSLPMIVSMLVQALYNLVDSVFISYLSEAALSAVSLAFSVQNLMIAVATGTGVGINALLSRRLGERDFEGANTVARNGIFLAALSTLAFALLGGLFSGSFFRLLTDDAEIIRHGTEYLSVCTTLSFGLFGAITFERLLQSTGKTVYSMLSQGAGAIINIVLDPIMIFGLLGFPAMGAAGAALATVIGQMAAFAIAVAFNLTRNRELNLSLKGFRPRGSTIKGIYAVGVPSIAMMSIGSVMNFVFNRILLAFTTTATAVFGVYFKLQGFIFMPVFGLNNGLVPIVAYNYGARRPARIVAAIRYAIACATALMALGLLLLQVFPAQLLGLFNPSANMLAIGVPALRIISVSFLGAGYCIVLGTVFQAMGHGVMSLINSVLRQLVVLLPAAWLLSLSGNLDLVWLSFPIAEIMSVVVSTLFLVKIYRTVIKPLGAQAPAPGPGPEPADPMVTEEVLAHEP